MTNKEWIKLECGDKVASNDTPYTLVSKHAFTKGKSLYVKNERNLTDHVDDFVILKDAMYKQFFVVTLDTFNSKFRKISKKEFKRLKHKQEAEWNEWQIKAFGGGIKSPSIFDEN